MGINWVVGCSNCLEICVGMVLVLTRTRRSWLLSFSSSPILFFGLSGENIIEEFDGLVSNLSDQR